MTQPTDDLAAQMVREMLNAYDLQHLNVIPASEAIARRYMEQAVAAHLRQPEKGSTDE